MSLSRSSLLSLPSLDSLDPEVIAQLPVDIRQELAEQYKQRAALLESEQQRQRDLKQREELLKKQKQKRKVDKGGGRDRSKEDFTLTQWKARDASKHTGKSGQQEADRGRKKRRLGLEEITLSSGSEGEAEKRRIGRERQQNVQVHSNSIPEHPPLAAASTPPSSSDAALSSSDSPFISGYERFSDFSSALDSWLYSFSFSPRFVPPFAFESLTALYRPEYVFICDFLQRQIDLHNLETVENTLKSMRFSILDRWIKRQEEQSDRGQWTAKNIVVDSSELSCWSSFFNSVLETINSSVESVYGAQFNISPIDIQSIDNNQTRQTNKQKSKSNVKT